MKNQVDDEMSKPIMILEQSFNYAEALNDPKVNIDFV